MKHEYTRTEEVLLSIKGVSLSFGSNLVLRDVDATITDVSRPNVEQGQVICFLGPSGIGKTQLSRIIAGLQQPTSGSVTMRGGISAGPGRACMVPQHYPMFDYATVAENLIICGKQAGLTKAGINERASGFIQTFSLEDHLGKYPRELSGGTRQRVAIARQLMCASGYMVMDEPFSGLDPAMKAKATEAIIKLSQMDTYNTIIIVTHDISEGLNCADTVWMMGYEKAEDGSNIPGARLVHTIDLAALGFAWRQDLDHDPDFLQLIRDVKDKFKTLR